MDEETATEMGIFLFDRDGSIVAFEEKPKAERVAQFKQVVLLGSDDEQRALVMQCSM